MREEGEEKILKSFVLISGRYPLQGLLKPFPGVGHLASDLDLPEFGDPPAGDQ